MANRPSRIVIPVRAPSYDGRYWGRYPNGDKPITGADLAAIAQGLATATGPLATAIRMGAASAARAAASGGVSTAIRLGAGAQGRVAVTAAFDDPFALNAYGTYTTYVATHDGSPSGTGSEASPMSPQAALDQLTVGGRRVLFKASGIYQNLNLVLPPNSGATDASRCVVMNYPGQRPVLSGCTMQLAGEENVSEWSGVFTTIRGLDLRDVAGSLITVYTNYNGLIVEYCDLHHIETLEAQPQGGAYSGVYFRGSALATANATIRHCWVRDIHAPNSSSTDNLNGIGAYDARNLLIHNCGFLDIQNAGIRMKRANATTPNGPTVRNCLFGSGMQHALRCNISGDGDPRHEGVRFYRNLLRAVDVGVYMQTPETGTQSTDLEVYQNTFSEQCAGAVAVQAFTNIKSHSNAFLNSGSNYTTDDPGQSGRPWLNSLTKSDRNGYRRKSWGLFTGASYTDLAIWRALTGITEIAATDGLRDVNSLDISADTIATHFPNYLSGDYTLAPGSSLRGAGEAGEDIGYDPDDCGPTWSPQ